MKKVLILIGISICSLVYAKTYYVSTNGNNNSPGSISQPWRTWEMAFMTAQEGDTVFFRGGIYPHPVAGGLGMWVYNSGTRANPICFFNYPGEEPILDASNINPTSGINYGIRVVGVSHINIKGLTVRNFRERYTDVLCNGILVEGSEQIRLENIKAYNIGGIGIGVYDYSDTIWIKNCDVWGVCDSLSWWPGQNGVGIQLGNMPSTYGSKVYTSVAYVEGCRVWEFSDNGFAAANGGYVEYKNCWAFNGGYLNGEGCGFKMGPAVTSVDHTTIPLQKKLTNCISAINCYYGYSDNNRGFPPMNSQYINCVAYHNGYKNCGEITTGYGWYNLNYLDIYPGPNWITLNCISYDNESGTPGNYYPGGTEDTFLERYNSWNNPRNVSVTDDDFISLDWTEMLYSRKADNSLPEINFMKLAVGSDLIDAGLDTLGIPYKGSAPDIGYSEYQSASSTPTNPVYVSSVIENSTPARLEMTYNLALANITPAASAFAVRVNSTARTVSAVAISGTKVMLTLASPVVYGDVVTVAYTKPASNPMQTAAGGQAISISAQNVTNNVATIDQPPYVNISSPTKSTSFISPATITIDATANDSDGYIIKVEFYQGVTKLGEISTPPYSFTWKNVSEGTYSLTAVAYDNQNLRTTSEAVSVVIEKSATSVNQQPTLVIISPAKGKKHKKNDKIPIEVRASDPDGSISKVEFKNGTVTLAEVTTEPYIYVWEATDTGTFIINAIATDNLGANSASLSVELSIDLSRYNNSENIGIYPNPNNGNFRVELLNDLPEKSNRVKVVNLAGKTVYQGSLSEEESIRDYNLPDLTSGTYVFIVTNGHDIVATKQFVKN